MGNYSSIPQSLPGKLGIFNPVAILHQFTHALHVITQSKSVSTGQPVKTTLHRNVLCKLHLHQQSDTFTNVEWDITKDECQLATMNYMQVSIKKERVHELVYSLHIYVPRIKLFLEETCYMYEHCCIVYTRTNCILKITIFLSILRLKLHLSFYGLLRDL